MRASWAISQRSLNKGAEPDYEVQADDRSLGGMTLAMGRLELSAVVKPVRLQPGGRVVMLPWVPYATEGYRTRQQRRSKRRKVSLSLSFVQEVGRA